MPWLSERKSEACFHMGKAADEEKLRVARNLVYGTDAPKSFTSQWKFPAFTAVVLSASLVYFYYIEPMFDPPEPLPPPPLPSGAVKRLPDGRLLMGDGSIRAS